MKHQIASLLLLSLVFTLGSCAFGDRKVTLKYQTTTSVAAAKPQTILVNAFADNRNAVEFGRVRNTYGMVTAKVHAPGQNAGEWAAAALASELQRSGHKVVRNGSAPVVIGGAVVEAYADIYFTINGNVGVAIKVSKSGRTVLDKRYDGKNVKAAWTGGAGEYATVLMRSLQDVMAQAVPDILKAIE